MKTDSTKTPPYPSWDTPGMTEGRFRKELRAFFDSVPRDPKEGPGFAEAEWSYICSLEGIDPH